jgi:hypothetical protein
MMMTQPTQNLNQEFRSNLHDDQIIANAYGHIVTIMQTNKSNEEKIGLIQTVFAQVVHTFQEISEMSVLQEQCIDELDRENRMLSVSNDNFIVKHAELSNKIVELANQINLLAKKNGLISQENNQLKRNLEDLIKDKQSIGKKQDDLESENRTLKEKIRDLSKNKDEYMSQQNHFSQQLGGVEKETDQLFKQSANNLDELEKLKQEYKTLQNENQRLDSKLQNIEVNTWKENLVNHLDLVGHLNTGLFTTAGLLAVGPAGIVFGCLYYGFHQTCKYYGKKELERELQNYSAKHPNASRQEEWEQVIRMRKLKKEQC